MAIRTRPLGHDLQGSGAAMAIYAELLAKLARAVAAERSWKPRVRRSVGAPRAQSVYRHDKPPCRGMRLPGQRQGHFDKTAAVELA